MPRPSTPPGSDQIAGTHRDRSFGLDCLRCLAIGGVVFSHGMGFLYPYVPALPIGWGRALPLSRGNREQGKAKGDERFKIQRSSN